MENNATSAALAVPQPVALASLARILQQLRLALRVTAQDLRVAKDEQPAAKAAGQPPITPRPIAATVMMCPMCGAPVPIRSRRGPRRVYCANVCRSRAHRRRLAALGRQPVSPKFPEPAGAGAVLTARQCAAGHGEEHGWSVFISRRVHQLWASSSPAT